MFKQIYCGLKDLVYPPNCLSCDIPLETPFPKNVLCIHCQFGVLENKPPFCVRCSRHLDSARSVVCRSCKRNAPQFDFAWCACSYSHLIKKLIYQFKYQQQTLLRHYFTRLMIQFIEDHQLDIQQFDLLVPIALHPVRLRERGYNQSLLLAELLGKHYDIPTSSRNLYRTRATDEQNKLKRKERWTNVRGAFKIKHPNEFEQKNILIIDDLLTTGATTSAAAGEIKKANANRVGVFTLAVA